MLLAEKLLLAKGLHLPTHEKAVVAAMDALGEPPLIVGRRRARAFMTDQILERCRQEAMRQGNEDVIRTLKDSRGAAAWNISFDKGYATVNSSDPILDDVEMDIESMTVGEIQRMMPDNLRQFMTAKNESLAQYESAVFLRSILSTGGIYRLDGGEAGTQGVLDSIWGGLPFEDLPKLPYPRMWFEARDENGEPCPLWVGNAPDTAWNKEDANELWGMAISELAAGTSWAVVAVRHPSWFYPTNTRIMGRGGKFVQIDETTAIECDTHRYERVDKAVLQFTPESPDLMWVNEEHSNERYATESAYRGAMMAWAVVLADIVTARNVDRRQTFLPGRTIKQLSRAAPMKRFFSHVYDVSISTATSDERDETGNFLHVRFMVRGHWRISDAPHAEWVEAKGYTCIWIRSHIKGPAGAPWKGRPVYTEPRKKK